MVAIIDYGVGNLFSLSSSFRAIGEKAIITGDPQMIRDAERVVLPGVGAFSDAAKKLRESGLFHVVREEAERRKPLLGICLGMQLLFETSFEYGVHTGLGLIPGQIRPISDVIPPDLKVPHIGWNSLTFSDTPSPIFRYLKNGDFVYFVHSFYATGCDSFVSAVTEYGAPLTAAVQRGSVFGCQFHPEKSGEVGLKILKAFCETEVGAC